MMTTWIFVVLAVCAFGLLLYVAVRNYRDKADLEDAILTIRSVDLEAFRNLVDPAEDDFLRSQLSPKQFRDAKRKRTWAALAYVWHAGKAAGMLASVAQTARRSPDPKVAASGAEIADRAIQLRIYTVKTSLHLVSGAVMPGIRNLSPSPLIDQYGRTTEALLQLGRLQRGRSA